MNDMTIHCEGRVKNWDNEKAFGFIHTTSLGNIYSHISGTKKHENLIVGQKVRFTISSSEQGLIAKDIEVI